MPNHSPNYFRGCLGLLLVLLCWTVWSQAPEGAPAAPTSPAQTNATAAPVLEAAAAPLLGPPPAPEVWITFGLDRIALLNRIRFVQIPLWQYLATLIYVSLAFYCAKLVDAFTRSYLKKWASKTQTKLDDLLVGLMNGPVKIVAFVILLHIGLAGLDWPPTVRRYLTHGLTIVVAVSLTYAAVRALDMIVLQWRRRVSTEMDRTFNDQFLPFIRTLLRIFVIILAGLVTLQSLGIPVTGMITGLGIGGLAFALAAQDTVANLFGAVAVFLDKPFHVGDTIKVENIEGVVEGIGLRSTRVRHPDGHLITVPNKTMGNAVITNLTLRPTIKTTMNIGITYDTTAAKMREARAILHEVFGGHPMTHDLLISFNRFGDSALNFQVTHWFKSTDNKAYQQALEDMNLALKERFDRAGIAFAFPSQTLYVRQDSGGSTAAPHRAGAAPPPVDAHS